MENTQDTVVEYQREGMVTIIKLNRPEKLNAFNRAMYRQFNEAIRRFNEDPESRVAVVTATGRFFSAGIDVKDLQAVLSEKPGTSLKEAAADFGIELEASEFAEKPVIAAIQGSCYGEGLSLAMACDLRIAAEGAKFCMPEVKVGVPSIDGTLRMVHNIGLGNALELLLLAEPRDAQWALRTGLVNAVVPADDLLSSAMAWAQKIAEMDPYAIKGTREVAVRAQFLNFNDTVDLGWQMRKQAKFSTGRN